MSTELEIELDKDVKERLMRNSIKWEESLEFLTKDNYSFESFGNAVFNDIVIDIMKDKINET